MSNRMASLVCGIPKLNPSLLIVENIWPVKNIGSATDFDPPVKDRLLSQVRDNSSSLGQSVCIEGCVYAVRHYIEPQVNPIFALLWAVGLNACTEAVPFAAVHDLP